MPRRPVKNPRKTNSSHLWKPGQSGNPAGKPRGTKQITDDIREAFAMLLQAKIPELEEWLTRAAQKDPVKALDIFTKISERFVPALTRTEITGADGEVFSPITINLPNIPKVSLGVGAPSQNSLSLPPGEEIKVIGEGSPIDRGESQEIPDESVEAPQPMDSPVSETGAEAPPLSFTIPALRLSPNQLRDLEKMGEVPPGDRTGPEGMGEMVK